MKNKLKVLITLVIMLLSINSFAFEQSLSPKDNLTVGDKTVLKLKADGLTAGSLDKSETQLLNFGDFELLDIKDDADGSVDFVLTCFKAGKVELLSEDINFNVDGKKKIIKTKAMQVEIKSVLNPKKPSRDIFDIKGIYTFGHSVWWYIKIVAAVIAFILLLYFIYKFIKRKKSGNNINNEDIVFSIPPKEYALSQLDNLRTLDLIKKGQIKDYYDKLSDILRFYVSRVYSVDGLGKTTGELFLLLKDKAPYDYNRDLKNYLLNCDLVKFAKVIPSDDNIDEDFRKAKNFVERI
ncbi:MAG: hypothetical protein AB7E39_00480 [Endomicrobiaceae bacterium]